MRLLERLSTPASVQHKDDTGAPIIGFSDITALHQWRQRHGFVSIHGPVLTQLGRLERSASERLFSLLESASPAQSLQGATTLVGGSAEGLLLGGNLSVFTRLIGTPYMPDLDGAILLLEDVGERPYRLDRMWTHLQLAGIFRKVAGIVLGSFTGCEEPKAPKRDDAPARGTEQPEKVTPFSGGNEADVRKIARGDFSNGLEESYTSHDVLQELAVATGLPCAAGFPIGHGDTNEPVPLGVRVRLDATTARLTFLEAAVEA